MGKTIAEVEKRFAAGGVPLLDPVEDMDIKDDAFRQRERGREGGRERGRERDRERERGDKKR